MTGPLNYYTDYSEFIEGAYQKEIGWSNVRFPFIYSAATVIPAIYLLGI